MPPGSDQPSAAEQARRRFVDDMSELAERPEFRRFVFHLIDSPEWCRSHGLSAMRDSGEIETDPHKVYVAEGRRSIGVGLSVLLQRLSPQLYVRMLNEQIGLRNQQVSDPVHVPPRPPLR